MNCNIGLHILIDKIGVIRKDYLELKYFADK